MKKQGFTLAEIVIAITISVIIIGGVLSFLTKLQTDILISKQSTKVYTNLTDFIGTMNNFSKLYSSGTLIGSGTDVYNVGLLTRPDDTSGVLLGVVEQKTGNTSRLDPQANKSTYGKKIIAYQVVNKQQIQSIRSGTGTYNIDFLEEGLFKELTVTDFWITPYNSGAIFEYKFDVETPIYNTHPGEVRAYGGENTTKLSFTLDF